MTMTLKTVALMLIVATAGSAMAQVTPSADSCGVAPMEQFIGQHASVLDGMEFERQRRVISPGDAMSMDFNISRINFDLDEAGIIIRIWCG